MSNDQLPTLYLDCTATIRCDLNTGVQRIVRALIDRVEIFEKELGIPCVPIVQQYSWYYSVEDALAMTEENSSEFPRIEPKFRDIYFSIDSYWSFGTQEWVPFFKEKGCRVLILIYDLIPLRFPQYFDSQTIKQFSNSTRQVLELSDQIFCISKTTMRDVKHYAKVWGLNCSINYLEISPELPDTMKADVAIEDMPREYFLQVGTLEPRRGYLYVMEEFEKLWAAGFSDAYVIIGKRGFNSSTVEDRIKRLQATGYPIYWISDIMDDKLGAHYRNCKAVIVASYAEGYGLPLAEAMQFGKPVYANRLEVFGEVAGSYPVYFDSDCPGSLSGKIENHAEQRWHESIPDLIDWPEAIRNFCDKIESYSYTVHDQIFPSSARMTPIAINIAYRLILSQVPSEDDIDFWVGRGLSINDIVKDLRYVSMNSGVLTEELVTWIFHIFSNEVPDQETINYWIDEAVTPLDLIHNFMNINQ